MNYRNDGLNNPLSPNGSTLSWSAITDRCDEHPAVREYVILSDGNLEVTWVDGLKEEFDDPVVASRSLDFMSRTS